MPVIFKTGGITYTKYNTYKNILVTVQKMCHSVTCKQSSSAAHAVHSELKIETSIKSILLSRFTKLALILSSINEYNKYKQLAPAI